MRPNDFDFIGSDGGFLELEQEAEIIEHQIAWHRAKQMIAFAKFGKAVDDLVAAVQAEIFPILERLAFEAMKAFERFALHLPILSNMTNDLKAAERARSKADVKAKRRDMMKRRGRK